MKKRHLIVIVAAGFLLAGCYHTGGTQTQVPSTQTEPAAQDNVQEAGEGVTVHYTNSGFTPTTITVEVGTTVTFVNDDSRSMWVASSVHPTHKDLPGFDQLKGSGKGTSYTYTFSKAGEWSYHNHLSPSQQGKVIVK